ncbi:MAG: hypothetical protein KAJ93_06355 [Methanosarcinales archaeon]|nr:hypothetical protein [Methanosarcinales archaeon]
MENHKEKLTISIEEYWQRDLPKVNEREIKALIKAGKELQCSELLIIT